MTEQEQKKSASRRRYPQVYEKLIPIALALIGIVIIALVLITMGVALGLWARPI